MEHTEGDWESTEVALQDVKDAVFYHTDVICNDTTRVAKSSGVGKEQALANARLIAAAPDLLAACELTCKECQVDSGPAPLPACKRCKTGIAIAKAKKS